MGPDEDRGRGASRKPTLKDRGNVITEKTKHRKQQKGRIKGNAHRGNQLAFGTFGIKSLDMGRINISSN